MKRTNNKIDYSYENLSQKAAVSKSYTQLIRALGSSPSGKQWDKLKRELATHNISTAHFRVGGGNRGLRKPVEQMTTRGRVRAYLLDTRGLRCEQCQIIEWQGQVVPIEVDHIDGDRFNNSESNLRLLCPNCHALTPTWRGRSR